MKKLRITVDGKAFEVTVEVLGEDGAADAPASARPVAAPVIAPSSAPSPVASGGAGSVPSPLAGKVVAIGVQTGQPVREGDTLVTLEAMKMNTFVTAHTSGTVGAILVKVGDPVEEGQELMTLS